MTLSRVGWAVEAPWNGGEVWVKRLQIWTFFWVVMLLLPVATVSAQEPLVSDRVRSEMRRDRESFIRGSLPLSTDEEAVFWPLYREYNEDVTYVGDWAVDLYERFVSSYRTLSDEEATELLDEFLALRQEELDTKSRWVARFLDELPAKTVGRFFQLENQMEVLIKAGISDALPLVRVEKTNEFIDPPSNPASRQ